MKKTLFIALSCMMLFGIAGCKQSNAEQELAQLRDSLNNAKMEQQKLYDDSVKKVQEEQRQQAIADSIANAKKMEAAQADNYIREELKKYLLDKKSRVVVTASAKRDSGESAWGEMFCPAYNASEGYCDYDCYGIFLPEEGTDLRVLNVGKDSYKFSVVCPCGCGKRDKSDVTLIATLAPNGDVLLQHVL